MKAKLTLVKLPDDLQVLLYLIREELKSRKFFHALEKAGLGDSDYQPNLDSLILHYAGLDSGDETFEDYDSMMERRSSKICEDQESITRQALKAYQELKALKSKRQTE